MGNNEGYSKYCRHPLVFRIDYQKPEFRPTPFCFWPLHVHWSCWASPSFYHWHNYTLQGTFLFLSQSSWRSLEQNTLLVIASGKQACLRSKAKAPRKWRCSSSISESPIVPKRIPFCTDEPTGNEPAGELFFAFYNFYPHLNWLCSNLLRWNSRLYQHY